MLLRRDRHWQFHETSRSKRTPRGRRSDARGRADAGCDRRRLAALPVPDLRRGWFRGRGARRGRVGIRQRASRGDAGTRPDCTARRAAHRRVAVRRSRGRGHPCSRPHSCAVEMRLASPPRGLFQLGFDEALLGGVAPATTRDGRDLAALLRAAAALSSIRGLAAFDAAIAGLVLDAVPVCRVALWGGHGGAHAVRSAWSAPGVGCRTAVSRRRAARARRARADGARHRR